MCSLPISQFLFIFYFVKYQPIRYAKTYEYPGWGEALGFCISGSSMIWVPGYALYFLYKTPGTLRERLRVGVTPVIKQRSDAVSAAPKDVRERERDVEMSLVKNEDTSNHV